MGYEGVLAQMIKGPVHKYMDLELNHQDTDGAFDRRSIILAALKDPSQDYIQIMKSLCKVPAKYADYVGKYWYDPNWQSPESLCWWKAHQPAEPISRQSLIDAIEIANEANLPIDSYWLPVGESWEVLVSRSEYQVTRLMMTPPSPLPRSSRSTTHMTALADIWVTKRGEVHPWEQVVAQAGADRRQSLMTRMKTVP